MPKSMDYESIVYSYLKIKYYYANRHYTKFVMPNDVMLIIIRQIKSMPKHFCAKEELCRKTVMPNEVCQMIIIIIISLSQSTAGHRPLQLLAISLDLRLLASSSHQPSCVNRHSTWPEGVLRYVYLDAVSTPELVYPSGYRFYG
jgi:hypothetical protein